jgi:outer membrane protein TolC
MKLRVAIFLLAAGSALCSHAQPITVEQVVQTALQKNYEVRLSQNSAALASNEDRYGFGVFLPTVNGQGAYVRNNVDSRNVTFGDVETIRTGAQSTNINASVQLVWTLFDGTQMFATRKRIAEQQALGQLNLRNQMVNTAASVIANYYGIVRQKQQLKAIQEQTSVSEERVKLAERKLQVGTGGKPELLQAKVDLNAFRTAALAQETLIRQLTDLLNAQLGLALPEAFDVTDSIPIITTITLEEITQDIENTNTALAAARKSIQVSEQTLRESRAGRSPVINFTSAYNFNRIENELVTSPIAQKYIRNRGYNYGLSVSIPLLNNMNTNRLIGQSKVNVERQKLLYEQQLATVTAGVRIAYTSYANALKVLQIEEENILLARENVNIALEGFRRGITTFIELRTAQQSLADAYNRLIAARFNAKVSETELLRLHGSLVN